MGEQAFAYATGADVLLALPVGDALKESANPECPDYASVFFDRAKKADAAGDDETARGWRLLANLCQVSLKASEPDEPFGPVWQDASGRTLVPGDMDEESAEAIRQLGFAVADAELRARLLDAIWDRHRDPSAAREAVGSYVKAAEPLFDPEHWTQYAARMERAARLARQLSDGGLVDEVLRAVEDRVVELDGSDPLYLSCRLMRLLHEFERGDPTSMRAIAEKGASLAEGNDEFERARTWHDLVGQWCRRSGDDEGAKAARIAVAASFRNQAEQCSDPGQELQAAHLLEKAHEVYRNIPGMRPTAEDVYARLREIQRRSVQYLGRITTEIPNASELIEQARSWVAGKTLREALLALATVSWVTDFETETQTARELIDRFPLQGMFGGMTIDGSGRVVGRTRAALTTDQGEFEQALWERVVRGAELGYQVRTQTGIISAINQINFEHSFRLEDLVDLVVDNPFVPRGHEELFARGFLAGFRWSFAESLSVLVPQLENSLRHVLAEAGHELTTRDSHGLQNYIQLGRLLSNDSRVNLEAIFGTNIVQELRVLFADQNGPNLRNLIAHGLMPHEQFFHHASIYAWWFIFHLTICPVRNRFVQDGEALDGAADPDTHQDDGRSPTADFRDGGGPTVKIGYLNRNNQKCQGHRGQAGTDHNQLAYRMECRHCGHIYGANGSDVHQRKCPECQHGAAGIAF